jgi:hypothetical protein
MKKIYFALFFVGLLITSCGGTGYTTDKDEALEQLKQIAKDEEEGQKTFLEDLKSWKEEKDKILKEYSGKESKLLKKAKKDDEDALDALADLRALDIKVQLAYFDMEKEIERRELVWNVSQRDIISLMDDDDQEDWYEDTEDISEKRSKANRKFSKKVRKIWDAEDEYKGEATAYEAVPDDYYDDYGVEKVEKGSDKVIDAPVRDYEDYYDEEGYGDYGTEEGEAEYYDDYNYSEK